MSRFKRIAVVAASLIVILVVLGGIKALQIHKMVAQAAELRPPPETVTTSTATTTRWQSMLTSVGSLVAVEGVTVSAEVPGKVVRIAFKPGSQIRAGQLLVVQDTSSERVRARAAEGGRGQAGAGSHDPRPREPAAGAQGDRRLAA